MLVGAPKVTRAFVRYRHLTAAAAVLSALVWCSYAWVTRDVPASEPVRMAMRVVYAVDQWAFIATIMGYAARRIHSTTPLMKYLGGGIFTFYIVHQTLIVVAAANVEKLKLPLFAEMGIVLFITVGGSVLAYEIAKRIGARTAPRCFRTKARRFTVCTNPFHTRVTRSRHGQPYEPVPPRLYGLRHCPRPCRLRPTRPCAG